MNNFSATPVPGPPPPMRIALDYNATLDTWIDRVGFQIPFILETIGFGYICLLLLFIIIFISIFGKSIETYQCFILNQAFWDFLFIYDYICEKPTYQAYFQLNYDPSFGPKYNQYPSTCFYGDSSVVDMFNQFVKLIVHLCSFTPLFLLTFSRFLCMYYSNFYNKHFTTFKTILFIIVFEILVNILLTSRAWARNIRMERIHLEQDSCKAKYCPNILYGEKCIITDALTACNLKVVVGENIWELIFGYIQLFLPILLLIFSIIFAISIATKVAKQIIYQAKNNPTHLYSSVRITLVILFQCVMTAIVFSFMFSDNIMSLIEYYYKLSKYDSSKYSYVGNAKFRFAFYPWLPDSVLNLGSSPLLHCLYVGRIFIDSILVLVFLSHYRKYCLMVLKYPVWFFKNVYNVIRFKKFVFPTAAITPTSSFQNNTNALFKKRNSEKLNVCVNVN